MLSFEQHPKEHEEKPLKSAYSKFWAANVAPLFHWHKDRCLILCVQQAGGHLRLDLSPCKQAQTTAWAGAEGSLTPAWLATCHLEHNRHL